MPNLRVRQREFEFGPALWVVQLEYEKVGPVGVLVAAAHKV
jgi:hypothetical protein